MTLKYPKECEGCFYQKPRDSEPGTKELTWGPWCLKKSGAPVQCEKAIIDCEFKSKESKQ